MNTEDKIKIMQAWLDGKTIQVRYVDDWLIIDEEPQWNFGHCAYRIKPEPREWEVWSCPHTAKRICSACIDSSRCDNTKKLKVREVIE